MLCRSFSNPSPKTRLKMVEKDELGLSLSLSCSCSHATITGNMHLNLMPIPFPSPPGFGSLNEEAGVPSSDRASSRGISDDEDGVGDASRKKLRLSQDQSAILEDTFKQHATLNPKQKMALAKQLGLRPRQIEVWFQNRRARTKLKQTEVDCEFLKRCCDKLTEENHRLQKEVRELRALKLFPHFSMHSNHVHLLRAGFRPITVMLHTISR